MDFKFSKDSDELQQQGAPADNNKQRALLVLLLILVGGFTYVYFFTGLIKPQVTPDSAKATAPAPQVVKMPLPPREGDAAKPDEKSTEKAESSKPAAPATAAAPAAKPAVAPAKPAPAPVAAVAPAAKPPTPAKPAAAPAAKPAAAPIKAAAAPTTAKPKEEPKKAEAGKTAVAKAEDKKAVPAVQAKQPAVAKTGKTDAAWSLVVGNYVLEEAISADMGRVRKAGFDPVVKPSERKKSTMHRLFVTEYADRETAHSNLEKLKRHTSDAFVIDQGGKFVLYAGSYIQSESAKSQKERLVAAGYSVTIKNVEIAIPSQSLIVGPFKSKKEADAALIKLKSAGIKATLSQK